MSDIKLANLLSDRHLFEECKRRFKEVSDSERVVLLEMLFGGFCMNCGHLSREKKCLCITINEESE